VAWHFHRKGKDIKWAENGGRGGKGAQVAGLLESKKLHSEGERKGKSRFAAVEKKKGGA